MPNLVLESAGNFTKRPSLVVSDGGLR